MTDNVFLKRYLNGECEQAWAALMRLPISSEHEALALEVAEVFVDRADDILAKLWKGFEQIGYAFMNPDSVVTRPARDVDDSFEKCESTYGRLPIILKTWYRRFGSIDFRQDRIQEENDENLAHLGHRIPLIFLPFSECLKNVDDWRCEDGRTVKHLPTGHYSTNENSVGFCLPSHFFDDRFDSDFFDPSISDYVGSFGSSLRQIFSRGGLHGFWGAVYEEKHKPYNSWNHCCNIKEIMPLLRQKTCPL